MTADELRAEAAIVERALLGAMARPDLNAPVSHQPLAGWEEHL